MFINIILLTLAGITLVKSNPILQALSLQPSCQNHQHSSSIPLLQNVNPYEILLQNVLNHKHPCQNTQMPYQNPMSSCQKQMTPCQNQLNLKSLIQNQLLHPHGICQNEFYCQNPRDDRNHCTHNKGRNSKHSQPKVVNNYIVLPPEVFTDNNRNTNTNNVKTGKRKANREKSERKSKVKPNCIKPTEADETTKNVVHTEPKVNLPHKEDIQIIEIPAINAVPINYMDLTPHVETANYHPYNINTGDLSANYDIFDQMLRLYNENPVIYEIDPNHVVRNRQIEEDAGKIVKDSSASLSSKVSKKRRNGNRRGKSRTKSSVSNPSRAREEAIVQEFQRRFPQIPFNLIRDLIRQMKLYLREGNNIPHRYLHDNVHRARNNRRNTTNRTSGGRMNGTKLNKGTNKNNTDTVIRLNKDNINQTVVIVLKIDHEKNTTVIQNEEHKPTVINETSTSINESEKIDIIDDKKVLDIELEDYKLKSTENNNQTSTESYDVGETIELNNNTLNTSEVNIPNSKPEDTELIVDSKNSEVEDTKLENVEINNDTNIEPEHTESEKTSILNEELPMYMNAVDDYYPDFTNDNQAYDLENTDEVTLKDLEDKYYYTTDKNFPFEELNRERRKYEHKNNRNIFQFIKNNVNKVKNPVIETITQEIQFKTPPLLGNPDFETKKVDFSDIEDVIKRPELLIKNKSTDKFSTYSQTKSPQYDNEVKKDKSNVETVFANSKVVKYGQNDEFNEMDISNNATEGDHDDSGDAVDNGPTLVFAESIPC